jgi:betaine reductase
MSNFLAGKKVVVIGERDGVQSPSIAKCTEAAGVEVAYAMTQCFV